MRITCCACLLAVLPAALGAQAPTSATTAVNTITPDDVARRIGIIADDSMRGRNTPSPELDEVAEYVAGEFRRFGLAPGGDDDGYLQRYAIQQVRVDTAHSVAQLTGGPAWRLGRDAVLLFGQTAGSVSAPVTVVDGRGEDVGPIERADLAGRAVLAILPPPPASGRIAQAVFGRNPAAIVLVQANRPEAQWRGMLSRQARPSSRVGDGGGGAAVLEILEPAIAPVLARAGYDVAAARRDADRPVTVTPLPGLTLTMDVRYEVVSERTAPNTVGILEGSDPVLKDEYVVFSAHMDHVGVGNPVNGDSIYNGADDDASGTIGVVELSEAFAALHPRPRRSMIFLTVSGEEKGLWGSDWFARHPPVPIGQIVADLNADMIGRNWRDTIVVIGKEHSDLGATLERVNAAHPELGMTAIDDIWPEEGFYRRSDHFNFARRGVPVLFFFNGTHPDYHQPSDHPDKIDAEKEARIVKLMFYLGLEIANATERPKWNPDSYKDIVSEGR